MKNCRKGIVHIFVLGMFSLIWSWPGGKEPEVVKNLDLNRYVGIWYEIARLPNSQEKGMVEVTSTLERNKNGKLVLVNHGFKGSRGGKRTTVKGEVEIPDQLNPAKMKIKIWWFSLDYKIIDIDKTYQYALVTSDSEKYLWIFSKSPVIEPEMYNQLVETARKKGFAVDNLEKVSQDYNSAMVNR